MVPFICAAWGEAERSSRGDGGGGGGGGGAARGARHMHPKRQSDHGAPPA